MTPLSTIGADPSCPPPSPVLHVLCGCAVALGHVLYSLRIEMHINIGTHIYKNVSTRVHKHLHLLTHRQQQHPWTHTTSAPTYTYIYRYPRASKGQHRHMHITLNTQVRINVNTHAHTSVTSYEHKRWHSHAHLVTWIWSSTYKTLAPSTIPLPLLPWALLNFIIALKQLKDAISTLITSERTHGTWLSL